MNKKTMILTKTLYNYKVTINLLLQLYIILYAITIMTFKIVENWLVIGFIRCS